MSELMSLWGGGGGGGLGMKLLGLFLSVSHTG